MVAQKEADENLSALNTSSTTAIWKLLFYIFAVCAWTIERLIDTHKAEVSDLIASEMPHTLTWYQAKAKAFRYGQSLIPDTDKYSDGGLTDEDIETMQIVKSAAVVEATDSSLTIKVATKSGDALSALTEAQKNAFGDYMNEVRDAGVKLNIVSATADKLKLKLRIRVDSSVINADGTSVKGGKPIEDAINNFLLNLPFNGELILASLVDALQAVDGVKVPHIDEAKTSNVSDYSAFTDIDISAIPYSGYFVIDTNGLQLTII